MATKQSLTLEEIQVWPG